MQSKEKMQTQTQSEEEKGCHDAAMENCKFNSVVVLTSTILSITQTEVLCKGLNFSPDTEFDLFRTLLDINKFSRLLTVKTFF